MKADVQIGRNVASTLVRQLIALGLGLALTAVVARYLGAEGNGHYAIGVMVPTVLASFLNLGLSPANVYFVGRREVPLHCALRGSLLAWSVLSVGGCGLAVAAVSLWGAKWFPGVPEAVLYICIGIFPVLLLREFVASLLQATEDFARFNKLVIAAPLTSLALAFVMIGVAGWGVVGAVLATGVGAISGMVAAIAAIRGKTGFDHDSDVSYLGRALSYGWKAHLSNIITTINYRADLFLVNLLLTPQAAGVYAISVQLAERLSILSQSVSTVLLPRLSALNAVGGGASRLTQVAARWVILASAVLALVVAILVPLGVPLVFGWQYSGAIVPLLILLPGVVLGSGARVLASDIAARGKPHINMYIALVVVAVNIVGNLLLVPRLGIAGASVATTCAYLVNFALKVGTFAKLSGAKWHEAVAVRRQDVERFRRVYAEARNP